MSEQAHPRRILLLGVARSGTSWLGATLGRAPGVRYYNEPDWFGMDQQRKAGTDDYRPYPMVGPGEPRNPLAPVWDMVFAGTFPFMRGGMSSRLRPLARTALRLPRSVRDPLTRRVARLPSRTPRGLEAVVAKSVGAMFSLDWLLERYSDLQLVSVQRNPLNVVSSWREQQVQTFDVSERPLIRERYLVPSGIAPPARDASELTRIAWLVGLLTHVVGEAFDRHADWPLFTHEELCVDPAASMHAVFDRLGFTWSPDVAQFLADNNRPGEGKRPIRVTSEQPGRWRGRLTDDEVAEINEVLQQFPRQGWLRTPAPEAAPSPR